MDHYADMVEAIILFRKTIITNNKKIEEYQKEFNSLIISNVVSSQMIKKNDKIIADNEKLLGLISESSNKTLVEDDVRISNGSSTNAIDLGKRNVDGTPEEVETKKQTLENNVVNEEAHN
uniref:Uncharacterized protein n=1 Tax=Caenorhabditis tropicalis TaxID=1561998 RepID=A0A1I7U0X4_9PELO